MIEYEINSMQTLIEDNYDSRHKIEETRYIIVKKGTNEVLDDAQGYGYKSVESASKAAWYKYKGGKEKILSTANKCLQFWNQNPEAAKYFSDSMEWNFKELARNEITIGDITTSVEEKYNIEIPKDVLKNFDMMDASYRKEYKRKWKK
jgi:hypothetical protein